MTVESKMRDEFVENDYLNQNPVAKSIVGHLLDVIALREHQWCFAVVVVAHGDTDLINRMMRTYTELRDGVTTMPGNYHPKSVFRS